MVRIENEEPQKMKVTRTERFGYWSFVLAITTVISIAVARHEGIALVGPTVGLALLLGYLVDILV